MTDADASDQSDLGPLDEIRPGAWFAAGRQMVVSDELVRGLRFAHHVTQGELMSGWLEVVPDFAAIAAFAHRATLVDGGEVEVLDLAPDQWAPNQIAGLVLKGPEGWLDASDAGATAVLALDGKELTLTWSPPLGLVELDTTPIVTTFEQLGGGQPVPLLDLVLHLILDHRSIFEPPVPLPLRDILLASGLDVEGTTVVRASVRPAARTADPVGLPGLGISSALAAERLLGGVLGTDADTPIGDEVLAALADAEATSAVMEQVVGGELVTVDQLATFVDRVAELADAAGQAGVAFLRSRLAEWQGDAAGQEAALAPLVAGGRQPAALVDAAWFAADRGDAREAQALLRAAHVPNDDPDVQIVARYTATGPRWVGRNDPCWCGSGRKHKQCCLHLNGHDVESRVPWLHAKAVMFLQRPPQRAQLLSVATASAGLTSPDDAPARVIAAACDAAVAELCLFEGGAFARFVEQRGHLLPEEERALATSWAAGRHRVWEVVEGGAALRDPSSGDQRTLDTRSRSKVPTGGWVLAVVQEGPLALPGPVTILNEELVDEVQALLVAGDPHALAALVGRELGWTSAPDLGSSPDPAPDALAPTS